ncbi:hypothetical protein GJU94_09500 [Brucella sp. 10RB9214]|nr:hypothetical protein BKD02_17075 [Brucella sp. 09RB8910]MRN47219.1 hypothetical protein [Brucella sp. 10RB9212]MRN50069.1 hypothetical protein [Brucella sp. 10RB9214]
MAADKINLPAIKIGKVLQLPLVIVQPEDGPEQLMKQRRSGLLFFNDQNGQFPKADREQARPVWRWRCRRVRNCQCSR